MGDPVLRCVSRPPWLRSPLPGLLLHPILPAFWPPELYRSALLVGHAAEPCRRAAYGELDSHTCEAPDTLLKLPVFVCCSFLVLLVVIVSKLAATLPLKAGNTLLACLAGFPLPCVLLPAAVLLPGILPYCWPHDCL